MASLTPSKYWLPSVGGIVPHSGVMTVYDPPDPGGASKTCTNSSGTVANPAVDPSTLGKSGSTYSTGTKLGSAESLPTCWSGSATFPPPPPVLHAAVSEIAPTAAKTALQRRPCPCLIALIDVALLREHPEGSRSAALPRPAPGPPRHARRCRSASTEGTGSVSAVQGSPGHRTVSVTGRSTPRGAVARWADASHGRDASSNRFEIPFDRVPLPGRTMPCRARRSP